jgi:RNA 2',3'-cyclic 3'-phosphodiesterase
VARNRRSEGGRGRPGRPRARLFLALEPAEADRASLAAWREALVAGREDLRPVAAHALHVTLVFLGWQLEADVEAIWSAAAGAAAPLRAARLTPGEVRPIPPRRPRLFALDLGDEAGRTTELQAALSDALEAAGLYRPERRPFWPHITLARVRRGARAEPLEPRGPPPEPFGAATLTLYRSTLRPQGAIYDPLARLELPAAAEAGP